MSPFNRHLPELTKTPGLYFMGGPRQVGSCFGGQRPKSRFSPKTKPDRITEVLEGCFALSVLCAIDEASGAPRFKREKKFYFRNPLIYWAIKVKWQDIPTHLSKDSKDINVPSKICWHKSNFLQDWPNP